MVRRMRITIAPRHMSRTYRLKARSLQANSASFSAWRTPVRDRCLALGVVSIVISRHSATSVPETNRPLRSGWPDRIRNGGHKMQGTAGCFVLGTVVANPVSTTSIFSRMMRITRPGASLPICCSPPFLAWTSERSCCGESGQTRTVTAATPCRYNSPPNTSSNGRAFLRNNGRSPKCWRSSPKEKQFSSPMPTASWTL